MSEVKKPQESQKILRDIEATEPLLAHLAEQLLDTDKERWNILIGDDAGGRLPTRFVHDILKRDGRDLQTFFIAGSKIYRDAIGSGIYDSYCAFLAEQVGQPLRPLIVTESVGSGLTVDFIREHLRTYCSEEAEVATVAVSESGHSRVDYAGGVGDAALHEVRYAYESPVDLSLWRRAFKAVWGRTPSAIKRSVKSRTTAAIHPPSANTTVGLRLDVSSLAPVARRSNERNGALSAEAYASIRTMARETYDRTKVV